MPETPEAPDIGARPQLYVLDDDRSVLRTICEDLEEVGLTPRPFFSPNEFLLSIGPGDVGALVVDLRMPELTGLEVLTILRSRRSKLCSIMLSGEGDVGLAVDALRAGALDFIEKPYRAPRLVAAVRRALTKSVEADAADRIRRTQIMIAGLSPVEREVLAAVSASGDIAAAAERLGFGPSEMDLICKRMLANLQVDDPATAIRMAREAGFAPPAREP